MFTSQLKRAVMVQTAHTATDCQNIPRKKTQREGGSKCFALMQSKSKKTGRKEMEMHERLVVFKKTKVKHRQ